MVKLEDIQYILVSKEDPKESVEDKNYICKDKIYKMI